MNSACKICHSTPIEVFAHTARCSSCGALMFYPYPTEEELFESATDVSGYRDWYFRSSFYNQENFTKVIRFAMDESNQGRELQILDFGAGGGQFGVVLKSLFPMGDIYAVDVRDDAILTEWKPLNRQILFNDFASDRILFDYIFLNDVFEHLSDPLAALEMLKTKLKIDGKIFIDTPKQFWIYPVSKFFSKTLYTKILKGTVSKAHLQIWTKRAIALTIRNAGLQIDKYKELSEYTMPPEYYLQNMGIKNPLIRFSGKLFYSNAKYLANNKIYCLLSKS